VKQKEGRTKPIDFTVHGQPQSKANSRRLVQIKGKPLFIKSKSALQYVEDFSRQCPVLDPMFEEDVHVHIKIYYASRRPDLDESIILDCMQGRIYRNDRQVRSKLVEWGLDKEKPRAIIHVEPRRSGYE